MRLWTRRLGPRRKMSSCKESDIFSATKCFEVGLTRKSSTGTGVQTSGLNQRQFAERLLCQPFPIARLDRDKLVPLCGDCRSRLSASSSSNCLLAAQLRRYAKRFHRSQFTNRSLSKGGRNLSYESRTMLGARNRGFDWKEIAKVLRITRACGRSNFLAGNQTTRGRRVSRSSLLRLAARMRLSRIP